jgi:hypothetical protein
MAYASNADVRRNMTMGLMWIIATLRAKFAAICAMGAMFASQ